MHLPVNTLLQGGRYRIVRFISSGSFGCTYEAEHVISGKRVAIKEFFVKDFCNRDGATSQISVGTVSKKGLVEKLRRKFIDEAIALCRLHHPGIVSVSDVFEENGTAYYVMDYIEGRSLGEIVNKEGPLSEERALRYIRQVSAALQYVHENNRLHLDIKPGNIMIDGSDDAILINFGASKQYDEESGENTLLLGRTPGYAPPEQMSNSVVKFLPATDIYALGATFYKLLTGVTPLTATLLASGKELEPLPSHVSGATREAVSAAMSINKNQRPQTVGAFLQLLGSDDAYGTDDEEGKETVFDPEPSRSVQSVKPVQSSKPVQSGKPKKTSSPDGNGQENKKAFPWWTLAVAAGVISVVVLLSVIRSSGGNVIPELPEIEMVYVAGGTFKMGAMPEQGSVARDNEFPVHDVQLSGYYIGKYEVTQALWESVMGSNPSEFKGPDLPVECVSWNDVQEFIRKLNTLTGKSYRLPTEAEWEYAARGGNKSRGYKYSGSDDIGTVAWYSGNSGHETHPVGTKAANELGIHDMSGNVWEWCSDRYGAYSKDFQTNPGGPSSGFGRVGRGGSWYHDAERCRVSERYGVSSDDCDDTLGFRLAASSL